MTAGEPSRMLDSEGLGEALRTDLERAAAHEVPYDVEAGAARFEATLSSGGPPPGGGGEAAAGGLSAKGLSLVVGLAVVVGGGAIAWSLAGAGDASSEVAAVVDPQQALVEGDPAVSPEPEVHESAVVDESAVAAPPVEAVEAVEAVEPAEREADGSPADVEHATDAEAEAAPKQGARGNRSRRPEPRAPSDDDRLRREMQATDRARQALAGDPGRALSLVRQANREFKGGLFSEDREGIAILALFGLDRDDEARRRAKAFLKAHPRSSYADKIRKAMAAG